MGDYDSTIPGSGTNAVNYGPPLPGEPKKNDVDIKAPIPEPSAPPPTGDQLKKLTTDVKSLGVTLPKEMLDANGNILPDKVGDAKKLLVNEAAKRKATDLGAAARLYQKAVSFDPQDKGLRLEAAKTWKAWSDQSKDPQVKKTQLEEAFGFIKDLKSFNGDEPVLRRDGGNDPEVSKAKYELAFALGRAAIGEQDFESAKKYLRTAIGNSTPEQAKEFLDNLKKYPHPELLDGSTNELFVCGALIEAARFEEAKQVAKQAADETTDPKLKKAYINFFHGLDETVGGKPYTLGFDDKNNPLAQKLYQALQKQKVHNATITGQDDKAESPTKRHISPGDLYKYIGDNIKDPAVQAALKEVGIQVPPQVSKTMGEKGFAAAMAEYHAGEAKKLATSTNSDDTMIREAHLLSASYFEPTNAKRFHDLGDFYAKQKNFDGAVTAYSRVRELQPMNKENLIALGKALTEAGDPKKALECYKMVRDTSLSLNDLAQYSGLDLLEDAAAAKLAPILCKEFDDAFAKGNKADIEQAIYNLEHSLSGTPENKFQMLTRRHQYYDSVAKDPQASGGDKSEASKNLERVNQQIEELRTKCREGATVKAGETPTVEQLALAKTAAMISISLKDKSAIAQDLDVWFQDVKAMPKEALGAEGQIDQLGEIYKTWSTLHASDANLENDDRTKIRADIGHEIEIRAAEILKSPRAKEYLAAMMKDGVPWKQNNLLSAEGLKKMETEIDAGDAALARAEKQTNVPLKRGDYVEAAKHFAAIGDEKSAKIALDKLEATMPAGTTNIDRLQVYGLAVAVLKDSDLSSVQEFKTKAFRLGEDLINSSSSTGTERAKELIVAKAFFDSVPEMMVAADPNEKSGSMHSAWANSIRASEEMRGLQDKVLNQLMFGDPKITDPKKRLELAGIVLQIDAELLGADINTAAKTVQEIAEGKKPESERPNFSVLAGHLDVFQRELEKADLPVDQKLAQGTKLGGFLAQFKMLSSGDKPLIPADVYKAKLDRYEKTMGAILTDCVAPPENASDEQKALNAKVADDLKSKLHDDIANGNLLWSAQLDSNKLQSFAKASMAANVLLEDAKTKKGPEANDSYLKAAALFAQIGAKEKVSASLKPVEDYAILIDSPFEKSSILFNCAQIYSMNGQKAEADNNLRRIQQMDVEGAPKEVRELGKLAKGMRELNNGDTDAAKKTLAEIPDNKMAQELLKGLNGSARELRINQSVQILRTYLLSQNTDGSPEKQAAIERGIDDVLREAKSLMMEGKAKNFNDAIAEAIRKAPPGINGYIKDRTAGGNDSMPADGYGNEMGPTVMGYLSKMADPNISDEEAAKLAMKMASTLVMQPTKPYGFIGAVCKMYADNPYVKDQANKIINEQIPDWVKAGAIFSGLKGLACATPPGAFLMIFFAGSDAEAKEMVVNSLIAIGSFGIARGLAVGAEALWVAKMATVIESPAIMSVTKFGVRTVTEAAAFPVAGALMTTALTGKTDQWDPAHFKTEFLSMLVTFVLLHGAGKPIHWAQGKSGVAVAEAENALKAAQKTGQGIEAAETALNKARALQAGAKVGGYLGNVLAFTGAEYVNEGIGLKQKENVGFWMKFLGAAVTDAQMKAGGKMVDGLTNMRITRLEMKTARIAQAHEQLPKFLAENGMTGKGDGFMKSIQSKIDADPKFDPMKFFADSQASLKVLEPALDSVPKEKRDQVRDAMIQEMMDGKLDLKIARQIAKRIKDGKSVIEAKEDGTGYDLVAGEKSIAAKKKEDAKPSQAQANAKAKAEAKTNADAQAQAQAQAKANAEALRVAKEQEKKDVHELVDSGVTIKEPTGRETGFKVEGITTEKQKQLAEKLFLEVNGEFFATKEQFAEYKKAYGEKQAQDIVKANQEKANQARALNEAQKQEKAKQKQEWRGAFEGGVTITPNRRKGVVLNGYKVEGVTSETAKFFMKNNGEYWATTEQFNAYQKYRVDMKAKGDVKAEVIAIGSKLDAKKPANENDNPEIRMAARSAAVDVLFNPDAKVTPEKLSKDVETVVSVVEALEPVLKKLNPDEKSQFQEQIIRQIQDGTLDAATAKKMADRVANGENPKDVLMGDKPSSVSAISLVSAVSGEKTPVESLPPPPPPSGKLKPKELLGFTSDRVVTDSTKKAIENWINSGHDAPKTQAEIDALVADLRKGAELKPDGKILVISDGHVTVETVAQVKERMTFAMKTFDKLQSEGVKVPDFAKRAILERALKQAGKSEADIEADVRYAMDNATKFAGEMKDIPKPIARNLAERYLRGDINLYTARQTVKQYQQLSERAKALGIEDFDARMQARIENWYPESKGDPSVAMEKSLNTLDSVLKVIEPLAEGMDPAARKEMAQKVVDGKMTVDQAQDYVIEKTLGSALDAMPPKEAEATVRQFLKTVLGPRYTEATATTYDNYFKAYGAKKVMADALSAIAFDFHITTHDFIKLGNALEGLEPKAQMALLGNLIAQAKLIGGTAQTSMDAKSISVSRIAMGAVVGDTIQLAKQMHDLDSAGQAKLIKELGEGKYTLQGAMLQADRIETDAKKGVDSSDPDVTHVSGSKLGPKPDAADGDKTNPGTPGAKLKGAPADGDKTNPGTPNAKLKGADADGDPTNPGVPAAKLKAQGKPASSDPDATKPGVVIPFPKEAIPPDPNLEAAGKIGDPGTSGVREVLSSAGADKAKIATALEPFEAVAKAIEPGSKELAEGLRKDLETLKNGDPNSPEYKDALKRTQALQTILRAEGTVNLDATRLTKAVEDSKKPSEVKATEDTTVVDAKTGATALGILSGAVALFSPELAHAADGAAKDISSRGGIGTFEAAVIVGIGVLIAGPAILKKYIKRTPTPDPVTKDNPIQLETTEKKGTLYPYTKADMKNAQLSTPGKFNAEDSMVIGEKVYLTIETKGPGEKSSRSVLPMSIADAKRLGVEFDAEGQVKKVPPGEFVYYEGSTKKTTDDIAVAAKAIDLPIAAEGTPVALKDSDGNTSQLRPLSAVETGEGAPNVVSYGKAVNVEIGKTENDPVKVTVEVYDPADPAADPKSLAFGLSKPKALESRTFFMSRSEATQLGIIRSKKSGEPPALVENAVVVLNDEAANVDRHNRVYIPTSSEGGLTFYPSKNVGKKERVVDDIVKVDTELTSRQGDTVYVWMRTPDAQGGKGKLHGTEPVPMSLAEARKLGIYVTHDGKLKVESNEFIMTPVTKSGNDVLVGGKPFAEETGDGVSVMFRIGKDGKIEMNTVEKPEVGKAEILPDVPPADMSGKKIPDILKVLGPLGVGLAVMAPDTAQAATKINDAAQSGGWLAVAGLGLTALVGMAWWGFGGGGGGKGEPPNHAPMVPHEGVSRFEFYVGRDGRPTLIPGLGLEPSITFARGANGQWYAHEGRAPDNTAQGKQGNWQPIKDGQLIKLHNPYTGEAYVIPFQAPKDAWIPGYAPPVVMDGPPQVATSGPLPTGKLTQINPYVDDRPFAIGRTSGDLQYGDPLVSNPHVTIRRDLETGQYVLINGEYGNQKMSTNGILVDGQPMQNKWVPLKDGQYFALKGSDGNFAYFQFKDPGIPVGQVSEGGYVTLGGNSYKLDNMGGIDQRLPMIQGTQYGKVTYGSPIPGDPAGRITLEVYASSSIDPSAPTKRTAVVVTAAQAKQLGIVLGSDGRPTKQVALQFVPGIESQVIPQAAKGSTATPLVQQPPSVPPPPPLQVVPKPVEVKFGNQSFQLQPQKLSDGVPPGTDLGQITRLTPHVQAGVFVAEISYGPMGKADKKMVVNLSVAEMKELGIKFEGQGVPKPGGMVKVYNLEAPKPVVFDPVQMIIDDHVTGKPRKGEVGVTATATYGSAAGQTHEGIGQKKLGPDPVNEDAMLQGKDWAMVLDGMGGMGHGDKASSIPGEAIARYMEMHRNDPDQAKVMADAYQYGYDALWNSPLYAEIRAQNPGMKPDKIKWPGTVGVMHKVVPDGKGGYNAIIGHVGDAGAVIVDKNGKIKYRTEDQGMGQYLVNMDAKQEGKDPNSPEFEKKKRFHPQGNIVLGGIGGTNRPKPEIKVIPLEPGDRIIMFSDGVGDSMSTTEMVGKALKAKDVKGAQKEIMDTTIERLTDLDDAIAELQPGKRLPITYMGSVDAEGKVYDRDGKVVQQLAANDPRWDIIKENYGTIAPGEKKPFALDAFVDKSGRIFTSKTDGEQFDYYKPDNVTVHVYEHNPTGGNPPPNGGPTGGSKPQLKVVPPLPKSNPPPKAMHTGGGSPAKALAPEPIEISGDDVKPYQPPPKLQVAPPPPPPVPGNGPVVKLQSNTPGVVRVNGSWNVEISNNGPYPFAYEIGRATFNDSGDHGGVSAQHLRVFRSNGDGPIWIQDLGSSNGTRVFRDGKEVYSYRSGERKPGPMIVLRPGDQIYIGNDVFQVT